MIPEILNFIVDRVVDPAILPNARMRIDTALVASKANAEELLSKWSQLSQFKIPKRARGSPTTQRQMDDDCGRGRLE